MLFFFRFCFLSLFVLIVSFTYLSTYISCTSALVLVECDGYCIMYDCCIAQFKETESHNTKLLLNHLFFYKREVVCNKPDT